VSAILTEQGGEISCERKWEPAGSGRDQKLIPALGNEKVMTKLEIQKMKAEIGNCERIAKTSEGSMKVALLQRAGQLTKQVAMEEKKLATQQTVRDMVDTRIAEASE
jgi:hypothetical protein